jgi:spermidine synthase
MRRRERKITHFFRGLGISLAKLSPLTRHRSRFGTIELFRHAELGKVLVLNGEVQHVEKWAPLYHEPLVHLAASFVGEPRDILILGGGTLYAASEVLKYKTVRSVLLLDRDPEICEITGAHYVHAKACLKDERLTINYRDAYTDLPKFRNQFDMVINDGADLLACGGRPQGLGASLFSSMAAVLNPAGVCADVVYRHLFERRRTIRTLGHLRRQYRLALSLVFLPEYHGVLHVLTVWGKPSSQVTQKPVGPINREQLRWKKSPRCCPCSYYDPRFLHYYLYLPRYLRAVLNR